MQKKSINSEKSRIIKSAMLRADVTVRDVVANKIMSKATAYRKIRDPNKLTIAELQKLDGMVEFSEQDLLNLVR